MESKRSGGERIWDVRRKQMAHLRGNLDEARILDDGALGNGQREMVAAPLRPDELEVA